MDMISEGVTVLLVTHNAEKIIELCTRAVLLEKGELVCIGDAKEVLEAYGDTGDKKGVGHH